MKPGECLTDIAGGGAQGGAPQGKFGLETHARVSGAGGRQAHARDRREGCVQPGEHMANKALFRFGAVEKYGGDVRMGGKKAGKIVGPDARFDNV